MAKADIKIEKDGGLKWDDYLDKSAAEAVSSIYAHATAMAQQARDWYWTSIKKKKRGSIVIRTIAYALVIIGASGPMLAAVWKDEGTKLALTQIGVAAIAVAGLLQLCDTVFGWSSGWLRYISTVTAMEKLTLQFQLDWAGYFVARAGVKEEDKKPLFDLARAFELEIEKRRGEETDGWVAEFNRGMAALNEMIKYQKDATEKATTAAKSQLEARLKEEQPGAIEVTLTQGAPARPVKVVLDGVEEASITGVTWAKTGVAAGRHVVQLQWAAGDYGISRIADVPAGGVARVEMKLS